MGKHAVSQLSEQSRTFFIAGLLSFYAAALRAQSEQGGYHSVRTLKWPWGVLITAVVLMLLAVLWKTKLLKTLRTSYGLLAISLVLFLVWLPFILDKWDAWLIKWWVLAAIGGLLLAVTAMQTLLLGLCMFKRGFVTDQSDLVEQGVKIGAVASVGVAPSVLLLDAFLILTEIRTSDASVNQTAASSDVGLPSWLTLGLLFIAMVFAIVNSIGGAWAVRVSDSTMSERKRFNTQGFSHLSPEDRRDVQRILLLDGCSFETTGTGGADEISVLKLGGGVLIPDVHAFFSRYGVVVTEKVGRQDADFRKLVNGEN